MNPVMLQSLKSWMSAGTPRAFKVLINFADGTSETVELPSHVPPGFNCMRVGPDHGCKSFDDVDLNATTRTVYLLQRGATIVATRRQTIDVAGVIIKSESGGSESG